MKQEHYDVIIIGAGAAGLMCAIAAGKRGRSVLLIENCKKVGNKILISGGGRCNFTNLNAGPHAYQSSNPHFLKSALSVFTARDFVALIQKHNIEFYEKKAGQLFCKESARQIVKMLLSECRDYLVELCCNCEIVNITKDTDFLIDTTMGTARGSSLVVATGGLSFPQVGASGLGYEIAKQFNLKITKRRAGLVPFIFDNKLLADFKELSGISIDAEVSCQKTSFRESILFTHRGLSGPAILQVSSFWKSPQAIIINLLPDLKLETLIFERCKNTPKLEAKSLFSELLPKRFVNKIFKLYLKNVPLNQLSKQDIVKFADFFHRWEIIPSGTEGFRTAEVTVGGVDVNEISSKTFEAKNAPRLFFIGEVLDVTGWLGGYNLQWAWSSGYAAGQYA